MLLSFDAGLKACSTLTLLQCEHPSYPTQVEETKVGTGLTAQQGFGGAAPAISQRESVARVAKLNAILNGARLEDFALANENRSLTDVALEMLVTAGWIAD